MLNAAKKLMDEIRPEEPERAASKPRAKSNELFDTANAVGVTRVLSRLSLLDGDQPICPGCKEQDQAVAIIGNGLKCLHERCAKKGVKRGFRTPVDVVMEARGLKDHEAARWILESEGIEIPGQVSKKGETKPDPFEGRWIRLADHPNLLTDVPPKTEWAITQWRDGKEHGVLPRGKTGAVASDGGVGKTMMVCELAVSKACGGFWLETFKLGEPEPVLLALGEEDPEEAQRRIWRVCNKLELTPEQRALVAENLDVLPLHGVPCELTYSPAPGVLAETSIAAHLRDRLEQRGRSWGMLILEPLSRFLGGGIESNNELATRGMQTIERFCTVPGRPAVMVAHHSSEASTRTGESNLRGVTALKNALRWLVTVDIVEDPASGNEGLRVRNRKSNYSLKFPEFMLTRNTDPGIEGTLRLAHHAEAEALDPKTRDAKAKQTNTKQTFGADCDAVYEQIPARPAFVSNALIDSRLRAAGVVVGEKKLGKILEYLGSEDGSSKIVDLSNGAQSKPRQWTRREA